MAGNQSSQGCVWLVLILLSMLIGAMVMNALDESVRLSGSSEQARLEIRANHGIICGRRNPKRYEGSGSTHSVGLSDSGASVMDAQIGRNSRWYFLIGLTVLTMVYSAAVLTVKFLFL